MGVMHRKRGKSQATSSLLFKKCCSIRNYNFSLIEKQDGVPEQVESMLGDAVSDVAFDLYTGILSYVY